jgi:TonB family protein
VTLTTSTFPYGWYVTMVRTKLLESWSPPQRLSTIGSPASALLTFRISRGGVVSGVALVTSSGYTLLDRSALEALRSLGTLPPLPAAYREDHLDVVVTFSPAGV